MEIWHEIPEYTGLYEASSHGRIRSVEGKITSSARFKKRVWKQRIIKQKEKKTKNGRVDYMVTLFAESYADMDRQLNQYRGYTSRMVSLKREKLYSKSGEIYTITPF